MGMRKLVKPKSWKNASARYAPTKPMKLAGLAGRCGLRAMLKDGSVGVKETRLRARRIAANGQQQANGLVDPSMFGGLQVTQDASAHR
jgi:hypothetical protein